MTPAERDRIAAHVMQYRLAVMLQCAAAVGAALGLWRYGLPGLIAGLLGVWLLGLAKPLPDSELDKLTKR